MPAFVLIVLALVHGFFVAVFLPVHMLTEAPVSGAIAPPRPDAADKARLLATVLVALCAYALHALARRRWPSSRRLAAWSAVLACNGWLCLLYAAFGAFILLNPVPPLEPLELAEPQAAPLQVLTPIVWVAQLMTLALHLILIVGEFVLRIVTAMSLLTGSVSLLIWSRVQRTLTARELERERSPRADDGRAH
jgi:hypothetical protein